MPRLVSSTRKNLVIVTTTLRLLDFIAILTQVVKIWPQLLNVVS